MLAMLGPLMRPASISFDKLQQFLCLRISVGPEATVSKGPNSVPCPKTTENDSLPTVSPIEGTEACGTAALVECKQC